MLDRSMIVLCLRRRKLLTYVAVLICVAITSLYLPASVHITLDFRGRQSDPVDYESIYDADDNPYRPAAGWDRRPQQADDNEDFKVKVKGYQFLHQQQNTNGVVNLQRNTISGGDVLRMNQGHADDDDVDGLYDSDDYEYEHEPDKAQNRKPNHNREVAYRLKEANPRGHKQGDISTRATQLDQPDTESSKVVDENPSAPRLNRSNLPNHPRGLNAPATQLQMPEFIPKPKELFNQQEGFQIIKDYIYWAPEVIKAVPKGISNKEESSFLFNTKTQPVRSMHPPSWLRCGRPKNQFVVLKDGTSLCARYRYPYERLIQGEILSYHLSKMLSLDNVPVITLSRVNISSNQWRGVNITAAGWQDNRVVAFIQWINGLDSERSRVKMPTLLVNAYQSQSQLDGRVNALSIMSREEISQLIQWTNMIVFDYITGHYDRVASMQDGADQENKPSILTESIRNLRQQWHPVKVPEGSIQHKNQPGPLWLIDNESGLLDAYALLYHTQDSKRFQRFHRQMLQTTCIFSADVISSIKTLLDPTSGLSPEDKLLKRVSLHEPHFDSIPRSPEVSYFRSYFRPRLQEVMDWVEECSNGNGSHHSNKVPYR